MALRKYLDANAVNGWRWWFRYAYGGFAPMKFSGITYGGDVPTSNTGLTFQILIKASLEQTDDEAIVNDAEQGNFTFLSDPLIVGYQLDTEGTDGLEKGGQYLGELWVQDVDALYARQLVNEFLVDLSTPEKDAFGAP